MGSDEWRVLKYPSECLVTNRPHHHAAVMALLIRVKIAIPTTWVQILDARKTAQSLEVCGTWLPKSEESAPRIMMGGYTAWGDRAYSSDRNGQIMRTAIGLSPSQTPQILYKSLWEQTMAVA